MNNKEIQNKIEELENQLSGLKEELNKYSRKAFKPKIGDIYYCINSYSDILESRWQDDIIDHMRYDLGNCFETKEKTEYEIEKLKVIADLKWFAEEHNDPIDWNDLAQKKFFIRYSYLDKIIYIDYCYPLKDNNIYFSSEELLKQAIKEIGEDRIKKYYLGVEE